MNTKNESIKINGKNYAITFDERNKPILVEESAIKTPYNVAYPCANVLNPVLKKKIKSI